MISFLRRGAKAIFESICEENKTDTFMLLEDSYAISAWRNHLSSPRCNDHNTRTFFE